MSYITGQNRESYDDDQDRESYTVSERMTWDEAYEKFDDFIDETNLPVLIVGIRYNPSRVLRKIDPIAYREEFNNWADSEGIDTDDLIGPDRMER